MELSCVLVSAPEVGPRETRCDCCGEVTVNGWGGGGEGGMPRAEAQGSWA